MNRVGDALQRYRGILIAAFIAVLVIAFAYWLATADRGWCTENRQDIECDEPPVTETIAP